MEKSIKIRNSSIEAFKLFGILLIVISHVVQTLGNTNADPSYTYPIDLTLATTDVRLLIISMLQYSGSLGNMIFFVCSAWFLIKNDTVNKKKILTMLTDIWIVSVLILLLVLVFYNGRIGGGYILKSFFPTFFENNWYLTCYLLFYAVHPILNKLIRTLRQKEFLRFIVFAAAIYFVISFFGNYIHSLFGGGGAFSSHLLLWILTYFFIAYMELYVPALWADKHFNLWLLCIGFLAHHGLIAITNILGLHFGMFRHALQCWNKLNNPFLVIMVVGAFNLIKATHFTNRTINYFSKLSLFIYIIHENILLRTFYRPKLWQYIYMEWQNNLLGCIAILTVIVFFFGLICSIVYYESIHKLVIKTCNKLYPKIAHFWHVFEEKALKLN